MTATSAPTDSRPAAAPMPPASAPIPFARLLRVEWGKATDTRSARWLLGITALATALLMLVPLIDRQGNDQTFAAYLQFAAFGIGTLLPVVSILTLTTEWTQRTVLTTFVQVPRRSRVISAKVVVSVLIAFAAIAYGVVVTTVALSIAAATGRDVGLGLGAADLVGYALFVLVNIGMGVAFGALLHNTAAAVVLFYVLPTAFGILGDAVAPVGRWLDTNTTFNWLVEGDFGGHVPNILVSVLVWLVVPLALGLVRTARREIT
ncbi:hypothetical protein SAMN05443575_1538 [Jatrophihabitans endophyticus]|uniref:ABC-2 family transporter protein n=1 Tax=Jatrophihabitans endophyticus TaxID=1206085 RepID=A0A1M5HJ31_9ACTN|nr:hypothetical protein [Jatrophihabitans endophyticus]SHG15979.1 hypothetical protein SAMN05443575_1538 [Jatrophihabitans endophyticus]